MTKAKCRVPATSIFHKLPVTLSSPLHLEPTKKVGQAVAGSEAGWDPHKSCQPLLPVGQACFNTGCAQWG